MRVNRLVPGGPFSGPSNSCRHPLLPDSRGKVAQAQPVDSTRLDLEAELPSAPAAPPPRGDLGEWLPRLPQLRLLGPSPRALGGGSWWRTGDPARSGREAGEPRSAVCQAVSAETLFGEKFSLRSLLSLPQCSPLHLPVAIPQILGAGRGVRPGLKDSDPFAPLRARSLKNTGEKRKKVGGGRKSTKPCRQGCAATVSQAQRFVIPFPKRNFFLPHPLYLRCNLGELPQMTHEKTSWV